MNGPCALDACVLASGAGRLPETPHSLDPAAADMAWVCDHLWRALGDEVNNDADDDGG
jgi:hypothetical protein